jgi:hypothetical protein
MMRGLFLFLLLSLFYWSTAAAEVPQRLHYQGYLTNAVGEAVDCPDPIQCADSINLTFKLYDDGLAEGALWQENHLAVTIYQGNFHVRLGSETNLTHEVVASSRWLGISINGGPEMIPRQELASAAFAIHADSAGQADVAINATQLGGIDAAEYALPEDLQDGDADSLGALACAVDAVPKWNGSNWYCGVDGGGDDTTLSESEVDTMVANNGYAMGDHTVDTNTQLTEAEVDTMVDNNGYSIGLHTVDTMSALSCAAGEVAQWDGSVWVCAAGGSKISVGESAICNPANAGSMYLDAEAGLVWVCDGSIYNKLKYCGGICPDPSSLPCGTPTVDDCGDACTATGTALNLAACPDPATIPCGVVVEDGCGNSCGVTGQAPNAALCADPATVLCGEAISDSCGHSCGTTGTAYNAASCPGAESVACGQLVLDACGNSCGANGTGLDVSSCGDPTALACNTPMVDACSNDCGFAGSFCEGGVSCNESGCGICLEDWLVGIGCNGAMSPCTDPETGYHWKGLYNNGGQQWACWWHTKNQAWNTSTSTNFHALANHFGLANLVGGSQWCQSFASSPLNACSLSNSGYFSPGEVGAWGWCGGAPFQSGGMVCFPDPGVSACP